MRHFGQSSLFDFNPVYGYIQLRSNASLKEESKHLLGLAANNLLKTMNGSGSAGSEGSGADGSGNENKKPKNGNNNNNKEIIDDDEAITAVIEKLSPICEQFGMGGFLGFCSGYAAIKVGKLLAITVGLGFMGIQFANYKGYLNVNWKPVQESIINVMDHDGDGKFTKKDALLLWKKFKNIMVYQMPSSAGFSTGFAFGLYCG